MCIRDRSSICGLLNFSLPERESHSLLYKKTFELLDSIAFKKKWLTDYLSWEITLLEELGFGLNLSSCVVTGALDNLKYISPKSGGAVSLEAAGDWSKRLLPLPNCLRGFDEGIEDLIEGLLVTGYFLENKVVASLGQKLIPGSRSRFIELIKKLTI